jgi:hypothetical protein
LAHKNCFELITGKSSETKSQKSQILGNFFSMKLRVVLANWATLASKSFGAGGPKIARQMLAEQNEIQLDPGQESRSYMSLE